jgi:hypothetical protein
MATGMLEMYAEQRNGANSRILPTVEELTGRKPLSFYKFTKDYVNAFRAIVKQEHHIFFDH